MSCSSTPAATNSSCSCSSATSEGRRTEEAHTDRNSNSFVRRLLSRIRAAADAGCGVVRYRETAAAKRRSERADSRVDDEGFLNVPLASEGTTLPLSTANSMEDFSLVRAFRRRSLFEMAQCHWSVNCKGYDLELRKNHLRDLANKLEEKSIKYLIDTRVEPLKDGCKKVRVTKRRPAVHRLMDQVTEEFCRGTGMSKCTRIPPVEEKMFLWLNRRTSAKVLERIHFGRQVYIVNHVCGGRLLTDAQCLAERLRHNRLQRGLAYGEHICYDKEKIREVFNYKYQAAKSVPRPKKLFIDEQRLCDHLYSSQQFGKACSVKDCPQSGQLLCQCFRRSIFLPETVMLTTKAKFEEVLYNFRHGAYSGHRWLLRVPTLKGGRGVQFIDSADQLEAVMRYDIRKKLRGQFFMLQRYLKDPLLLKKRRVDCRMFLLVCVLTEKRVTSFLHPGFVRMAQKPYNADSCDLRCHLTTSFDWDADYNRFVEENGEKEDYCTPYQFACRSLGLPSIDWRTFDNKFSSEPFLQDVATIAREITHSMEGVVFSKPGTWELFGLDLAIDSRQRPWLYEVVTFPTMGEPDLQSKTQNEIVPAMLTEALTIVLELNQRDLVCRKENAWLDLPDVPVNKQGCIEAQQNFVWMYNTDEQRMVSCRAADIEDGRNGVGASDKKDKYEHWLNRWHAFEQANEYSLYLKNFRTQQTTRVVDGLPVGRVTFDTSPAFKVKQQNKRK